ncbi:energy transducer TonB [Ancylomarina sp. DW003]|nr:energy transducer TonB [Ancylomarina sp. DW003]MDE5424365.1 energy transducer TonB [Ancylomarina sp. DW003]
MKKVWSLLLTFFCILNEGGKQESIQQALPLPKGVSKFAVKGAIPITRQNQVLPPPSPKYSNVLNIVDDELEILDSEVDMAEDLQYVVVEEEEEDDEEPIFVLVEDMPEFPGGNEALLKYLAAKLDYPEQAKNNKVEGKVYVSFIIDLDGSIVNIKIVRGVNADLGAEAIRVIKAMPKWIPGKQRGKSVRVNYVLPIIFSLK